MSTSAKAIPHSVSHTVKGRAKEWTQVCANLQLRFFPPHSTRLEGGICHPGAHSARSRGCRRVIEQTLLSSLLLSGRDYNNSMKIKSLVVK